MSINVASLSGSDEPLPLMEVNTTPLIDVMLVLLVMLIITIPTQLHSVSLFIGGEPGVREPVVHEVSVDFDGAVYWDHQLMVNQEAVDAKMREVGSVAPTNQHEVHIIPNELVGYGRVAAVMASAQRNNVKNMGIVGNDRFLR